MSGRSERTPRRPARRGWIATLASLLLLLAALFVVSWRQTRGLALEREVREVETARAMAEAQRVELTRRIERLRSRERIVQVARDRLGMHLPEDDEIVFLRVAGTERTPAAEEEP